MERIKLITGNLEKAQEFGRLLGMKISHQKILLPEIQHTDVLVVARAKAEAAYKELRQPFFVDDTGL